MRENVASGVIGNGVIEVAGDADSDIEADQVIQVEGGGLGPSDQGTGQAIDFFDGVAVIEGVVGGLRAGERHEAIADEIGCIFAKDSALAQHVGAKAQHEVGDRIVSTGVGDDFQQAQITRRIEKVRAQEAAREPRGQACRDLMNGNARGIAADDGIVFDDFDQAAPSKRV